MTHIPDSLREQVRERANRRCEYCQIPEEFSPFHFEVDHLIPLKHDGPTILANLVWACFRCNNTKGSDVAAFDEETGDLMPLYNPRMQKWDDHFVMNEAEIVGKTVVGRVTVRILRMNHPKQIETRLDLIEQGVW